MTKACDECGAQNADDAVRCLACNKWLPVQTDRKMRKRYGPKFMTSGRRPGLRNYDENAIVWPVKTDDDQLIWTGERKQLGGFSDTFFTDFMNDYYAQRNGLNPAGLTRRVVATIHEYQCVTCRLFWPRKSDTVADNWISIDHRDPIRSYVLSNVKRRFGVVGGHSWGYYLLEECKAAHLTPANLQPMCQSCNSRAGGTKTLDGEMREHSSTCRVQMCRDERARRGNPY